MTAAATRAAAVRSIDALLFETHHALTAGVALGPRLMLAARVRVAPVVGAGILVVAGSAVGSQAMTARAGCRPAQTAAASSPVGHDGMATAQVLIAGIVGAGIVVVTIKRRSRAAHAGQATLFTVANV